MKHVSRLDTVLSKGFQPDSRAQERIKMALQRKLNPCLAQQPLKWALAVGSLFVLLGIGIYTHRTAPLELIGSGSLYATEQYADQRFGESGARGLETLPGYIHFQ